MSTKQEVSAIERAALKRAAEELRREAGLRFDSHGGHDIRGAAIWDSAAHIDPDEPTGWHLEAKS